MLLPRQSPSRRLAPSSKGLSQRGHGTALAQRPHETQGGGGLLFRVTARPLPEKVPRLVPKSTRESC